MNTTTSTATGNTVPEFVTIGARGHVVREDGWCEALGCWVFRDGRGRLITIPVD